jgi:hypothetical protein
MAIETKLNLYRMPVKPVGLLYSPLNQNQILLTPKLCDIEQF